ncbi:MAG: Gfo/Idh/MocA family oxidoreductase [Planctomycetia bacterium]|nr:Gfo/Idh/MocA family oxidoreductase [Planctomycetia bacterium]
METGRFSRRRLLQASGIGVAALTAGGIYSTQQRKVRLGLVGCGARGRQLAAVIGWTRARPLYGEIAAVCDVDSLRAEELSRSLMTKADVYSDYHRLLEREDLDAVVIATPDHWHTAMSLAAMKAGKAVYCEKPLTLTIDEGKRLVRAAKESKCVFQVGTQQRSDSNFQTACELVRNGRLGTMRRVKVSLPTGSLPPESFGGPFVNEPVPAHLDWDRWLGQAPAAEFCKQRFDPFRWWFEYSGGFMTDWGAHHLDIVQWALGLERAGPTTVVADAELPNVVDGYNTPRRFTVDMTYPGDVSVRIELSRKVNGILFEGDAGSIFVNRLRIVGEPYESLASQPLDAVAVRYHNRVRPWGTANYIHMVDFLEAVRSGEAPISDVESQHRAATACHLANIAMRLGRKVRWDADREDFLNDPEATAMLSRPQRAGYAV